MNSQQTQGDFYSGYVGSLNHSPNSTRPGYATTAGMPPAMGANRRNQQPHEPLQPSPSPYADDRFNTFDAAPRYDRPAPTQGTLPSGFGMFGANQASWSYNGNAATLNDGSRMRSGNRRAPLHAEWTNDTSSLGGAQGGHGLPAFFPPQHMAGQQHVLPNGDAFAVPQSNANLGYPTPEIRTYQEPKKDMGDLIPTAIVIKNIPFNVRKEFLTAAMAELNLPQPYAFNYHFDQGIFRGLAFANFQSASDTALVIERMNGLEVGGRKLRVEYKKMLPEHERERIEREKREKRGQLEEQHRDPRHQVSISSMTSAGAQRPAVGDRKSTPLSTPLSPLNLARASGAAGGAIGRVDLNDPNTLRYYLLLYMFRNDDSREAFFFPPETSPEDRRLIHILAHNMGLEHTSVGDGENRQVHVAKSKLAQNLHQPSVQQPGVTLDGHPRGLSRAATYDFNDRQHPSGLSIRGANTLAVPNSPEGQHGLNGLRGVKSFADLRSFSPSPSPSVVSNTALGVSAANSHNMAYSGHYPNDGPFGPTLTTPTTPGTAMNASSAAQDTTGLVNGLGSMGLGSSSYDVSSSGIAGRARDTPGAIGSQRPGANGAGSRANPERQPRGPTDWENASGFARARSNGHMQRGSDSSDNAGRVGTAHGSSSLFQ